jgi:hypothetical protein
MTTGKMLDEELWVLATLEIACGEIGLLAAILDFGASDCRKYQIT